MSIEFLLFTWPGLTQPKLIQLGGAFVLKMKALYVLPFIVIGIVNVQWGWEEEMRERGFTTFTYTVKPVTTSQTPLATTLPTSTTTSRPITTTVAPNTTISASSCGSGCDSGSLRLRLRIGMHRFHTNSVVYRRKFTCCEDAAHAVQCGTSSPSASCNSKKVLKNKK